MPKTHHIAHVRSVKGSFGTSTTDVAWRNRRTGTSGHVLYPGTIAPRALRSAAVLKPFIAWYVLSENEGLQDAAKAAVSFSDNGATDELVGATLSQTLAGVDKLCGTLWSEDESSTWGQVHVRAKDVVQAAESLLTGTKDSDESIKTSARQVLRYMTEVPETQTLGLVDLTQSLLDKPEKLAIKLGWDLWENKGQPVLQTNALIASPNRIYCVLTAKPISQDLANTWSSTLKSRGPQAVLQIHKNVAGHEIAEAIKIANHVATTVAK